MGRDLCDAKAAGSVAICEAEVVGSLLLCKSVHVEILRAGLCVLSKSSHSAGNSKVCEVHSKPTIQKALLDFSSRLNMLLHCVSFGSYGELTRWNEIRVMEPSGGV